MSAQGSIFRSAQLVGLIASGWLIMSTFIAMLAFVGATASAYPTFNVETYPAFQYPGGRLDCVYLETVWTWRIAFAPQQMLIEFFLAVGLLLVIHPIHCLRKAYSGSQAPSMVYNTMASAFFIGVTINGVEFLENLGTEATWLQLASIGMPCPSREALEIAYNLGEAMSIWLFSLDYLFLAVGFGVSAYLSLRYPLIPAWHGVLGALNALLCLAAFALEVAQVANSAIFTAFAVVTLVLMGICFPAWLIWLARIFASDEWKLVASAQTPAPAARNTNVVDLAAPDDTL